MPVVTFASEFGVVANGQDGADETALDGSGHHVGDHDHGLAEEEGEQSIDADFAVTSKAQVSSNNSTGMKGDLYLVFTRPDKELIPPLLLHNTRYIEDLSAILALLSNNDDHGSRDCESSSADSVETAWTEVNGMGSGLGKVGSLSPVDGIGEDLVTEELRD